VIRTPKSIFAEQLKAWDILTARLSKEDPFFARVVESQRAFAKRVVFFHFFNEADYKLGYEHIFKTKLPG
jgi:TRAP-type mannitol/chloroaromatic compound transport system substrate-binding protein